MPPLKAPAELEAPDTRNALKVPPLDTPERVRGQDGALPRHSASVRDPQAPTPEAEIANYCYHSHP